MNHIYQTSIHIGWCHSHVYPPLLHLLCFCCFLTLLHITHTCKNLNSKDLSSIFWVHVDPFNDLSANALHLKKPFQSAEIITRASSSLHIPLCSSPPQYSVPVSASSASPILVEIWAPRLGLFFGLHVDHFSDFLGSLSYPKPTLRPWNHYNV